jgi:hypothetical protein
MQPMPQRSRNGHCDNQKNDYVSKARVECLKLLTRVGPFDFALGTRTAATIPQFGQVDIFAVIRNLNSMKLISTRLSQCGQKSD